MGKDLWFVLHRSLMTLTVLLSIAAVILVVVEAKLDPLALSSLRINAHPVIGLLCIILAILQPVMAALRQGSIFCFRKRKGNFKRKKQVLPKEAPVEKNGYISFFAAIWEKPFFLIGVFWVGAEHSKTDVARGIIRYVSYYIILLFM